LRGAAALMVLSVRTSLLIGGALLTVQAIALLAMGHPAICTCGYVKLWHGAVDSAENSQHLTDWYSFSHVIHGFAFYALFWLLAPRASIGLRFVLALTLESGWEILENTPMVIERYRQAALAQGYVGDSVINSLSDSLCAALGFFLARRLPIWSVVALALAMELFVGYMIRDNLTLNIIQLLHPSEVVSRWQRGD
jgi:hypothetical protein